MEFYNTTMDDFEEILTLYEAYLNYGTGAAAELKSGMARPENFGYKCVIDGKIVGFFILSNTLDFTGGRTDFREQIITDYGVNPIWTGAGIAVKKEFRGYGISSKLIDLGFLELKKRGINLFLADMWVYPNNEIPASIFLQHSKKYKLYGEIKDFYKDMYKKQIFCPVCGEICHCGVKIYMLEI